MTRTISVAGTVLVLLVAACAHDGDRAGATTITSGTPEGVRVTNVTIGDFDPADRLAGELCRREATCGRIRGSDEARLLGEQNCVTQRAPAVRAVLSGWPCSPATNRARFEDCLAAVRGARCEARLEGVEELPSCRRDVVCAP